MAIKITNFGGLVPKASPRALPDNGAQVAQDLQADTTEFRPLLGDAVAVANTTVSNPKTIYRLARKADGSFNVDMTTGWIVKAGDMSFVKAQINDDTTERTYATFDDGSAPPRAYDATDLVTGRQLGVPAPATKPVVTVNVVDQFSASDRTASITALQTYVKNLCYSAMDPIWRGSPSNDPTDYRPGGSLDGWVDRDTVPGLDPQEAQQLRVFRLGSTGGANTGDISNTYAVNGADYYRWVLDPSLAGFYQTSPATGWPAWAGTNQDHWCLAVFAYGLTYDLDQTALHTGLVAIEKPGGDPGEKLLTSGQADDIVAAVLAISNQQWATAIPKLNELKTSVDSMHSLLGGGGIAQRGAALAAFYAKTDVGDELTAAIDNAAEAIWNLAQQAHDSVPYVDLSPGGGP